MKTRLRIIALGLLLAGTLLAGWRYQAGAENFGPGGGTRIIVGDQVIGPYQILATVSPEPIQTGIVTFAVRVHDPTTGETLKDVQVLVKLVNSDSKTELNGEATHKDSSNPIDYVAHIPVEQAGSWSGTLVVIGPAGKAEVAFTQPVLAPRGFSTVILVGIPFLVILAVLGGFWYLRSGSRH